MKKYSEEYAQQVLEEYGDGAFDPLTYKVGWLDAIKECHVEELVEMLKRCNEKMKYSSDSIVLEIETLLAKIETDE